MAEWNVVLQGMSERTRGRYASFADDAGITVEEYLMNLVVGHAEAGGVVVPSDVRLSVAELEDRIVEGALAMKTTREIAIELGLTNQRVNNVRRRRGVSTTQIGGPRAA